MDKELHIGMLINLALYIRNFSEQNPYSLIEELGKRRNYKPKGHPPDMVCTAVEIQITSIVQTTSRKFPLPPRQC